MPRVARAHQARPELGESISDLLLGWTLTIAMLACTARTPIKTLPLEAGVPVTSAAYSYRQSVANRSQTAEPPKTTASSVQIV